METTNFHQLYIFHSVAKLGSFSRAAEALNISQPAVSIQVREIEESLGSPLIHRLRKGLQLTDAGQTVYSYTQKIFALADEMQEAVQDIQGLKRGKLNIGSSTTPGEYILPWVIGQFRNKHPAIDVSLSITNTRSIIERVLDREFDMGMAGATVTVEGLNCFQYVDDELVIIASPKDEFSQRTKIDIGELDGRGFVLRELGSATRESAQNCLDDHGIAIKTAMELGSNEAVKRAVASGLGLGIISRFGVTPDTTAGMIKVLEVDNWSCKRPLTVFYRDDQHMPSAQTAFLKFLREERPLPPIG